MSNKKLSEQRFTPRGKLFKIERIKRRRRQMVRRKNARQRANRQPSIDA